MLNWRVVIIKNNNIIMLLYVLFYLLLRPKRTTTKPKKPVHRRRCAYVCSTEDTLIVPVNYVKHILFVANADGRERGGI